MPRLPACLVVGACATEQPRNVLGCYEIAGRIGDGEHVRQELLPPRPRRRVWPLVLRCDGTQHSDDRGRQALVHGVVAAAAGAQEGPWDAE
jgi:hypothetical protein